MSSTLPYPPCFGSIAIITPSDTLDCDCAAFFAGGAGNVTFLNAAGVIVLITALPVFFIVPGGAKRIMATGTTSTPIYALT